MSESDPDPSVPEDEEVVEESRRSVLQAAAGAMVFGIGGVTAAQQSAAMDVLQDHYKEMDDAEKAAFVEGLEERLRKEFDNPDIEVSTTGPQEDTVFGYAIDVGRCVGCRRCVYACAEENNISRQSESVPTANQLHWIKVLQFDEATVEPGVEAGGPKGQEFSVSTGEISAGIDWHESEHYYDPEDVPEEDSWYLPVQCQQCENPSCTSVCPVQATWKERDGIVVVDYDRCIGCKYCVTNCPYDARRFNFSHPHLPEEDVNPDMHYLGNRPRPAEVVEKCTFCIQRTREGEYPACVEACPAGARKFGNLLDPDSEIRRILDEKRVFRLKPELGNEPKMFYFTE